MIGLLGVEELEDTLLVLVELSRNQRLSEIYSVDQGVLQAVKQIMDISFMVWPDCTIRPHRPSNSTAAMGLWYHHGTEDS